MLAPMNANSQTPRPVQIPGIFDLQGSIALITGASGGLGSQFARTLHGAGATLVLAGRDAADDRLRHLARSLDEGTDKGAAGSAADGAETSAACRCESVDVRDAASVAGLFTRLADAGCTVDVLINNAGVASAAAAIAVEADDWDNVVDTNLRGPWLMAQAFAKALIAREQSGSVINIASILGSRTGAGTISYATAKAGLLHMTRCLSLEWARYGIRVNTLSPGYVLTDMNRAFFETEAGIATRKRIPQRRIGEPADLDGALLLLASNASRYMTGSDVVVDGGHLCSAL